MMFEVMPLQVSARAPHSPRTSVLMVIGAVALVSGCERRSERSDVTVGAPEVARAQLVPAGGEGQLRTSAALGCFQRARDNFRLGEGNAFLLCRGASSAAPAECYKEADDRTLLSSSDLFDLCRCATSNEPVECYQRAQRETFLEDRKIVQLCSPITTFDLLPSCARIELARSP